MKIRLKTRSSRRSLKDLKGSIESKQTLAFCLGKLAENFNTYCFDPNYLPEGNLDASNISDKNICILWTRKSENLSMLEGNEAFWWEIDSE